MTDQGLWPGNMKAMVHRESKWSFACPKCTRLQWLSYRPVMTVTCCNCGVKSDIENTVEDES